MLRRANGTFLPLYYLLNVMCHEASPIRFDALNPNRGLTLMPFALHRSQLAHIQASLANYHRYHLIIDSG